MVSYKSAGAKQEDRLRTETGAFTASNIPDLAVGI
jgi:hypothetical protein